MTDEAIRTERLSKRFGRTVALEGLDLEVPRGEIFGFLGPNGTGKSTTIRLLLNLIRPTSGRAWIMGVPVGDVRAAHRHLGYMPGDVALWPQLNRGRHPGRSSKRHPQPFLDTVQEKPPGSQCACPERS